MASITRFFILFIVISSIQAYKKFKPFKRTFEEATTTPEPDYSSNSTDSDVELNFDAAPTEATDLSSTVEPLEENSETTTETAESEDSEDQNDSETATEGKIEGDEEEATTELTTVSENSENEDEPSEFHEKNEKSSKLLDEAKEEFEREEKQKVEVIDWSFPYPAHSLQEYIRRGKAFARQYIGAKNMKRLHQIVDKVRKSGGGRQEIHKAVQLYLNKLLTRKQKKEINQRKAELDATFRFSKNLE